MKQDEISDGYCECQAGEHNPWKIPQYRGQCGYN